MISPQSERGGLPQVAVVGAGYWGKNLVRNFQQLNALRAICDNDVAFFAYPLSGGFDRPSLLPLWSVDILLRFEQWCRRFGRLLAFRLLVVLEKT